MNELPRFRPQIDSRPVDSPWPIAIWPVPADAVLVGRVVELRVTTSADAPELFAALDHDAVWSHVRGRPANVDDMQQLIADGVTTPTWCRWTLRLRVPLEQFDVGAVVGTSSFLETSPVDARTEIGFTAYTPGVWGTAVNPETKLLLLRYAFETLGMGRVQLKTDIRNVRSQQAIARLGATYEGVLRRYQRRSDGSVRDTVLFSITAEEWPTVESRLTLRLNGLIDGAPSDEPEVTD